MDLVEALAQRRLLRGGLRRVGAALRTGGLQVQDGPFADTKEAMAGVFVIDVPDLDAALGWAEKCPAASYGVIEVRPVATSGTSGTWSQPDCPAR